VPKARADGPLRDFETYFLTQKGPFTMEAARRRLDERQSEYTDGWNPPWLHTRHAGNNRARNKHGKAVAYTLLVRCGPSPSHWWSCVNVAATFAFTNVKSFVQKSPVFVLSPKFMPERPELPSLAAPCADAVAATGISKALYGYYREAFAHVPEAQCPPYATMRSAMDAILINFPQACTDSIGPTGARDGVICDPSWITAFILKQEHLREGIEIKEAPGEKFGLVFDRRPADVLLVIDDATLSARFDAETKVGRDIVTYVSEAVYGDATLLDHLADDHPDARLGWLRGPERFGTASVEKRTAIVRLPRSVDRDAVQQAFSDGKLNGITPHISVLFDNDVVKNIDGFVLMNIVASGTEGSNMGTQAQICYHVRGMRHSPKFCFPYAFYNGDDNFMGISTHARTPPPNSDKYRTLHAALQDMCNSPFILDDGRIITFCGPHVPDYKAGQKLTGIDSVSVMDRATNAVMGRGSGPLSDTWDSEASNVVRRVRAQLAETRV